MYKSYISLEIRILLLTGVKTFCSCGPDVSCPVCREEPGSLPVLNPLAARKACLLIRGLGGGVCREVPYERNLSAPVLPEISAGKPVASLSRLSIKLGGGTMDIHFHRRKKRVHITEIRLEEDAGRLIHGPQGTYMDYSRAGMPSLRIRTAPDFEIAEEAEVFLSGLRRRIQYLGIIPAIPRENSLESLIRCNAYVALAP
ncbi:MAG: glutamyl-tRNA amidotransferase, partial [Spirochaetaceae bacterium]|nr:glutamyl-tRNA amidotransferase [Spirochaetaceae bacterium]